MGKNNQQITIRRGAEQQQRWTLRKLSIGVASVMLGAVFLGGQQVVAHADETVQPTTPTTNQPTPPSTTGDPAGQAPAQNAQPAGDQPKDQPTTDQPTTKEQQPQREDVNAWMPTPHLDEIQKFAPTPENHVTPDNVKQVMDQINQYKQSEYQNQLAIVKKAILSEIDDRLDTTPAQLQAVKDEQDLFKLQGMLQAYSDKQDDVKHKELTDEIDAYNEQGKKDIDAAETPEAIRAAVKNASAKIDLVGAKSKIWSTLGTLIRAGYVVDSYRYLPNDQIAGFKHQIALLQKQREEQSAARENVPLDEAAAFEARTKATNEAARKLLAEIQAAGATNLANAQQEAATALADKMPNLKTKSSLSPVVLAAFQQEVKDAQDVNTVDILMSMAEQITVPVPVEKRDVTLTVHWVYATVDDLTDSGDYNNGYVTTAPADLVGKQARPDTILHMEATQQADGTWKVAPATSSDNFVTMKRYQISPNVNPLYDDNLDENSFVTRITGRVAIATDNHQPFPAGYNPIYSDRPFDIELPQDVDQLKLFNNDDHQVTFVMGRRYNNIQVRYVDGEGQTIGEAGEPTVVYADAEQPTELPLINVPKGYQLIPADMVNGPKLSAKLTIDVDNIGHVSQHITGYKTAKVTWDDNKIQWVVNVPVEKQVAAELYTPAYQPITVSAGATEHGDPTFTTTTDGQAVPVPAGTIFAKGAGDNVPAWATVDAVTGRVTVNPTAEVQPGTDTVPVTVTYSDQSSVTVMVKVTVKRAAPTDKYTPMTKINEVQQGAATIPAANGIANLAGADDLPAGTTVAWDQADPQTGMPIDPATGHPITTAKPGIYVGVPATVTYPAEANANPSQVKETIIVGDVVDVTNNDDHSQDPAGYVTVTFTVFNGTFATESTTGAGPTTKAFLVRVGTPVQNVVDLVKPVANPGFGNGSWDKTPTGNFTDKGTYIYTFVAQPDPVVPGLPDKPELPAQPDPVVPGLPDKPEQPSQPTPEEPGVPDKPEQPAQPAPETPGLPDKPEQPSQPTPETPGLSNKPEQPNQPAPETPGVPDKPEQPAQPTPEQPNRPETALAGATQLATNRGQDQPVAPTAIASGETKVAPATMVKPAARPASTKATAQPLPQTGNQHDGGALASLGLMGMVLGMLGLKKKRN